MIKVTSLHHFLAFSELVFLPVLASYCFQLPTRQPAHYWQLHAQQLCGWPCAGAGCMPLVWCRAEWHTDTAMPGASCPCCAHRVVTPSVAFWKPGCLSLMSGLQLTLSILPWLILPAAELAILLEACLSLSQTIRGFCPPPAGRLLQMPEASASICRTAASQTSSRLSLFSYGDSVCV